MVKKRDLIIFTIIGVVFGFFLIRQFYASREVRRLTQPENSEVLALDVARLTKSNAELRQEVLTLDSQINNYNKSMTDQSTASETLDRDSRRYQQINGFLAISGRGIILRIDQSLTQPQLVDLANTIRNIGVDGFAINSHRIIINSHFEATTLNYEIAIIGNPTIIKSALTRKSGFLDLLFPDGAGFAISEQDTITLDQVTPWQFIYANISL